MALGTGKHIAFDGAGFQAHRAGMFARGVTITARLGALAVKADHQGFAVAHPNETLRQADSAAKTAEQMACKGKFKHEQQCAHTDEQRLVASQGKR